MSTLGVRGLLACVFAVSLGLLAGAGQADAAFPGDTPVEAKASPGLLDHFRAKACAVSQGLSGRSDRASAEARRRDCDRRYGLDD